MHTKLTRIHLGLGMDEIGVQFEIDDGAGGTITQRAFITVDDAVLAPVWLAAQVALEAKLHELPLDMPPGAVTTALMAQRTAVAAMKQAFEATAEAERKAEQAEARRSAAAEEHARLDAEIAKNRAELAASARK